MFNFFKGTKPCYFGLNELDRKLEKYVDYDGGFYVELGANDGISQSNTYYFEQSRGWQGILIEPAPHNFLKCHERRGANNHVYCRACVSFAYPDKFVEIRYANLMSVSVDLDNDLEDVDKHIATAQQFLREDETSFTFGALAAPLNTILKQSDAPKLMDFLSLDVEGAELEVLKGLDHSVFRFRYLLIESRSIERLEAYLGGIDYERIDQLTEHDYLFRDIRA